MSSALLTPQALAGLHDLALIARLVVEGTMFGVHRSRLPGPGLEFTQYRSYQPGDDLRRVDWKLFGRSDRYFIRESETETSFTIHLVVDTTRSMAHSEAGVSKLDYARWLAAALAWLGQRQGDAIGLAALSDAGPLLVPARRDRQQLHRILHALTGLTPAGGWPSWERIERLLTAPGPGIVVLLTDLHEAGREIRSVAARLASLHHDVAVFHLLGRAELEFSWEGDLTFADLETGREVTVNAAAARPGYLAALERDLTAARRELEERGIEYRRMITDQPLDEVLRPFLAARRRLD